MKNEISFEIPGHPQGKARPKFAKRGKFVTTYTPEQTVNYEALIKLSANQSMENQELMNGMVKIQIVAFYQMPKSMSKRNQIMAEAGQLRPTVKPDWDNIGKVICDALNGVVYHDDKQIVEASVSKRYSHKPSVLVIISRNP